MIVSECLGKVWRKSGPSLHKNLNYLCLVLMVRQSDEQNSVQQTSDCIFYWNYVHGLVCDFSSYLKTMKEDTDFFRTSFQTETEASFFNGVRLHIPLILLSMTWPRRHTSLSQCQTRRLHSGLSLRKSPQGHRGHRQMLLWDITAHWDNFMPLPQ